MPTQTASIAPASSSQPQSPPLRASRSRRSRLVAARLGRAARYFRAAVGDERGSQITDNLGLIVIGIAAVVAIGGLVTGLDTTVFNWVTKQLGLG
jgi:hypothetical protein